MVNWVRAEPVQLGFIGNTGAFCGKRLEMSVLLQSIEDMGCLKT